MLFSTISSDFGFAALLLIMLAVTLNFLLRNLQSGNHSLNWLLVSLFGIPFIVLPLKLSFDFLNRQFVGSASNSDVITISIQFIFASVYFFRHISARESNRKRLRNLDLFSVLPAGFAFLALIYGLATGQGWLQPLYCFVIFVVAASITTDSSTLKTSLLLSLSLGLLGQILGIALGQGISDCRADKCLFFPSILNLESAGNGFGVRVLILILALFLIVNRSERRILLLFAALLILMSGSRTALYTLMLIYVMYVSMTKMKLVPRRTLVGIYLGIVFTISTLPAWRDFPQQFLTLRGDLWARGRELIIDSPFIGLGPSYWVRLNGRDSFFANYGAHNLWLDFGVAFGIIGIFGLLTWLVAGYLKMRVRPDYWIFSFLGLFLSASVESTLTFWTFGFAVPLLFVLISVESDSQWKESAIPEDS